MNPTLRNLVANCFRVPPEQITDELSMENCGQWTSLAHVELMASLEQTFGVTVSEDELLELLDIASIEAFLARQT
jgi:acyl carrier protein